MSETVTFDKSGANLAAPEAISADREAHQYPPVRYLNNVVEQDHLAIKRRTRPMLGFKRFRCARILLVRIELMHMIARGQMQCAPEKTTRPPPINSITLQHKQYFAYQYRASLESYCGKAILRPHYWCDRAYSAYTSQSAILIRA